MDTIVKEAGKQTPAKYWFPAKHYGWGWGIPTTWQGWLVLAIFVASLVTVSQIFPPVTELKSYLAATSLLAVALVAVCWLKGEPPRWRWGKRDAGRG